MKRYQMLMLEWNLESVPLNEINTNLGIAAGAGVGALGSAGVWAVKRLQLRKKLQACQGDPECEARVNAEIKSLRNKALVGGAAATLGGAAVGYGANVGYNYNDRNLKMIDAQNRHIEADRIADERLKGMQLAQQDRDDFYRTNPNYTPADEDRLQKIIALRRDSYQDARGDSIDAAGDIAGQRGRNIWKD